MSTYIEANIKITSESIKIVGATIPMLSNIEIKKEEIKSIKIVNLTTAQRLNLLGTQNLQTWWCFDKMRPFRKKGIIVALKESIGPFKRIGFTVANIEDARRVLNEGEYL